MRWQYVTREGRYEVRTESGSTPMFFDDVVTAACQDLPEPLVKEIEHYKLDRLEPYDARYLAVWPAEIYTLPVAEASLDARARILPKARAQVAAPLELDGSEVTVNLSAIYVSSFKLILLPAWLGRYTLEGKTYSVVINGQTGAVRGERPASGVRKALDWLLGEP
jgi:hypothetical protein